MLNQQIDFGEFDGFVRAARVARLASVGPDGTPHAVPVCYVYEGVAFYSVLDAKPKRRPLDQLQRVRNLRANPSVCLLIDEYDDDWSRLRYVLVHGRATLLMPSEEHAETLRRLREKYAQYQVMPLDANPVIKIEPTRWTAWKMR